MSNVTFPPDVQAELHRLAHDPRIYMPTEVREVICRSTDDSPTANPARYSYDPITQKVPRKGDVRPKVERRRKVKRETFNHDATDLAVMADIPALVAALPAVRMTMVEVRKWLHRNTLTETQCELIKALQPLANIVALQTGVGKYHLHIDDAKSIATDYLIRAVVCGARDDEKPDPMEFVESRIENGLHTLAKKQRRQGKVVKRSNRTVENTNDIGEFVPPEDNTDRMNDRDDTELPEHVPIDPAEREAHKQKQDAEWQRVLNKHRLRDEKAVDKRDLGRQQYEKIAPELETPEQRTVYRLVLAGETLDDAAVALRMTRHEVLEIARTLAV